MQIKVNGEWIPLTLKIKAPTFIGATAENNGHKGIVPSPLIGDQNKFLKGDGTWDYPSKTSTTDISGDITSLTNIENGWYQWQGTISSVTGTWIISKFNSLYSAHNIEDPRVLLFSNNLTAWYSPYAYWHA